MLRPRSPYAFSRPRLVGASILLLIWLGFAFWQRSEHVHQCRLIHDALSSRADVLSQAVRSGIQSHRWFSPFVQQQLPSSLDLLVNSSDAVAIAVVANGDVDHPFFAGNLGQVACDLREGEHVRGTTLTLVSDFQLIAEPPLHSGVSFQNTNSSADQFRSFVVLDRTAMNQQIYLEARNRFLIVGLGTLLLFAAAAVWQFTVWLAQSEGKTRLLTAETRHLRELGQAAAGLAHETRNPLGLIRGWTQRMVDSGLSSEEHQDQAEAVLEECDRVTARINQFLAFARQAELNVVSVPVRVLTADLEALLQSDLNVKTLTINVVGLSDVEEIQADPDQLRQVLFNLLQNAIAFAPEHSTITVSLKQSKRDTYRLEVADEGPGASDAIVDNLFEPYVTARPGGTGLGLSIVRRIATAHGWTVGYESRPERGGTFWIDGILPG